MKARTLLSAGIRDMLTQRGLTQSDLAARAGISSPYLSQVLHERRAMSLDVLDQVAEALNCSVGRLFSPSSSATVDETIDLTPQERAVVRALRHAGTRTERAISVLLGLPAAEQPNDRGSDAQESPDARSHLVTEFFEQLQNALSAVARSAHREDRVAVDAPR